MKKLTEEQAKLVADNHKLIYWLLGQKGLSEDDYYDLLAISLCKATLSFDKSKGFKFSTYAIFIMDRDIKQDYRKNNRIKREIQFHCDSLDVVYENGAVKIDTVELNYDLESDVIVNVMLDEFKRKLTDKGKNILTLIAEGYTQTEMAKLLGMSRANVSLNITKLKKILVS